MGDKTCGCREGTESCLLRLPQSIISNRRQNLKFEKSLTGQLSRAPVGKEGGDPGAVCSEISGSLLDSCPAWSAFRTGGMAELVVPPFCPVPKSGNGDLAEGSEPGCWLSSALSHKLRIAAWSCNHFLGKHQQM